MFVKLKKSGVLDFVERVSATFAFTFIGIALVTPLSDLNSLKAAAIAGALSAGKFVYIRLSIFLDKPED